MRKSTPRIVLLGVFIGSASQSSGVCSYNHDEHFHQITDEVLRAAIRGTGERDIVHHHVCEVFIQEVDYLVAQADAHNAYGDVQGDGAGGADVEVLQWAELLEWLSEQLRLRNLALGGGVLPEHGVELFPLCLAAAGATGNYSLDGLFANLDSRLGRMGLTHFAQRAALQSNRYPGRRNGDNRGSGTRLTSTTAHGPLTTWPSRRSRRYR